MMNDVKLVWHGMRVQKVSLIGSEESWCIRHWVVGLLDGLFSPHH